MQTTFAFGKAGLTVSLPDGPEYTLIEGRSAGPLADADAAIGAALDNPIGSKPLVELAAGKRTAAISVCDITRPAPNRQTLPPLLDRLHAAGIPVDGITILIATGLHRGATEAEIQAIVGPEIASRYRVVNHDARALASHRSLGSTADGTPVFIDRRFLEADLHLTLGFIEQHLMLGFSGGRKLVAPGLAAQQTIKVLHSPRFMRETRATEGSIENNPLHAELLEIARMARHDFLLDVTLTQQRAISGVFAGSPVPAHAAGVAFLRSTSLTRLPSLADAVIASAAGHPLDLTFYQSVKGITAAQHVVKFGGRILIVSQCAEGVGSPEFAEKLRSFAGNGQFLRQIADSAVAIDQWQLEKLALVGLGHEIFFYTPGVQPEQLGALGARCFSSLDQAVAALLDGLPTGASVALIPEGPYAFAQGARMKPDGPGLKDTARSLFEQALAACSIECAFDRKLRVCADAAGARLLVEGQDAIALDRLKQVRIVSAGKAAAAMLTSLLSRLPLPTSCDVQGVLIAPGPPEHLPATFQFFPGGHPLPNAASFAAALAALAMLHSLGDESARSISANDALCIFLPAAGLQR